MQRLHARRLAAAVLAALTLTFVLATQAKEFAPHRPVQVQSTDRIVTAYELPGDRVYPEGITADPLTGSLYVGSAENGAIFKMTPGLRVAEEFLPAGADGRTTALGLEADRAGRLWVVDQDTGVAVYDIPGRRQLARFGVPPGEAPLVNDLAITPDGSAYITDSLRAVIYRITPEQLERAREHGGDTMLTRAFDLTDLVEPGTIGLNGIVADPSGRYLLTVDMTRGDLYRIGLPSGEIRQVTLSGGDLRQGDGLELHGHTLWAAHPIPSANSISRWRVTRDGRAAHMDRRTTDQALQLPTTLVRENGRLYVVRSQFDKGGPVGSGIPRLPFTIASVHGI